MSYTIDQIYKDLWPPALSRSFVCITLFVRIAITIIAGIPAPASSRISTLLDWKYQTNITKECTTLHGVNNYLIIYVYSENLIVVFMKWITFSALIASQVAYSHTASKHSKSGVCSGRVCVLAVFTSPQMTNVHKYLLVWISFTTRMCGWCLIIDMIIS